MKAQVETIKVCIRFKGREKLKAKEVSSWAFPAKTQLKAPNLSSASNTPVTFNFDSILVEADQQEMYNTAAEATVKQFTSGFNGTIFVYGGDLIDRAPANNRQHKSHLRAVKGLSRPSRGRSVTLPLQPNTVAFGYCVEPTYRVGLLGRYKGK